MKFKFLIVFLFFTNIFSNSIGAPLTGPNKGKQIDENENTDSPPTVSKPISGGKPPLNPESKMKTRTLVPVRPNMNAIIDAAIAVNSGGNYNDGDLQESAEVNVGKAVAKCAIETSSQAAAKTGSLKQLDLQVGNNINKGKIQRSGNCNIGMDLSELDFPQTGYNAQIPTAVPYGVTLPAAPIPTRPTSESTLELAPVPMSEEILPSQLESIQRRTPSFRQFTRSLSENTEQQSRRNSKTPNCGGKCSVLK